jgi:hypothetical protein
VNHFIIPLNCRLSVILVNKSVSLFQFVEWILREIFENSGLEIIYEVLEYYLFTANLLPWLSLLKVFALNLVYFHAPLVP